LSILLALVFIILFLKYLPVRILIEDRKKKWSPSFHARLLSSVLASFAEPALGWHVIFCPVQLAVAEKMQMTPSVKQSCLKGLGHGDMTDTSSTTANEMR
jgi:hypothetical protein